MQDLFEATCHSGKTCSSNYLKDIMFPCQHYVIQNAGIASLPVLVDHLLNATLDKSLWISDWVTPNEGQI